MSPEETRLAIRQGLLSAGASQVDPLAVPSDSTDLMLRASRCTLCQAGSEVVIFVNRLIVGGATYAQAYRALSAINEARVVAGQQEISYQTVNRHGRDHLPAKSAAVREIVERRARAARLDVERGTANIVTQAAFAEAMMVKAFQDMASVEVTPAEGLQAAKFLSQLMQAERGSAGLETAFAELGYIIEAMKEVVPQHLWPMIMDKIDEKRGSRVIDAEVEEFDPGEQLDEDLDPVGDDELF